MKNPSRKAAFSRRAFLGRTLQGIAAFSAATDVFMVRRLKGNPGNPQVRRALINVGTGGSNSFSGWDSYWLHSGMRLSDAQNFPGANSSNSLFVPYNASTVGTPTPYGSALATLFTERFPVSEGMSHPNQPSHFLGAGFASIFAASDIQNMLIWKGLNVQAGHGISNEIILHGNTSAYDLSFSSLIASGIAQSDYQRPLHYVTLTATPFVFTNMATGVQIPTCIPGVSTLQAMTAADPNDMATDTALRSTIQAAVANLATTLSSSRFKLSAGKAFYGAYAAALTGYQQIAGTNLGSSYELQALSRWYTLTVADQINSMLSASSTAFYQYSQVYQGAAALSAFSACFQQYNGSSDNSQQLLAYLTAKNLYDQGLSTINPEDPTNPNSLLSQIQPSLAAIPANPSSGLYASVVSVANLLALADFMVRKDLSAVVDVQLPGVDAHDSDNGGADSPGALVWFINVTAYRQLMRSLAAYQLPTGAHLLDTTTLFLATDFDRQPNLSQVTSGAQAGSGHGLSVSALLAGGLVKGGTVVGDIANAVNIAPFGGSGFALSAPLPVDPSTGLVSASGTLLQSQAIFPTMLAIYGFSPPAQQQTTSIAVPAVVK